MSSMTSAMRNTALSAARMCMRQKVLPVTLTSTKNIMSQVKIADRSDNSSQDFGPSFGTTLRPETYQVYTNKTRDSLSINMENIPTNLQRELIDNLGLFLDNDSEEEQILNVNFNYISEDVYRTILCGPFRKLGYRSMFSRYNDDKGLVSFKLDNTENQTRYSYFRSGLPNKT